jgi:hypothetical protein
VDDHAGHIATMARIVREDVKPLGPRAPWVPAALASVVDAGLARNRDERIPDASTLAARLIEAFPEAANRTSLAHIARATDISELGFDEPPPPTVADPSPRSFAWSEHEEALAVAPLPLGLADTANPPPSSSDVPSSAGERVQIFVRAKDLPPELAALRKKKDP